MRRAALLATLIVSAVAAPAGAWFESAGYDVPGGQTASCLRGASPGRVALLDAPHGAAAATDLLDVGLQAFAPGTATALGRRDGCTAVAVADGALPLLAAWEPIRGGGWSDVALRVASPGGKPTTIRTAHGRFVNEPRLALASGGAAVVVWVELPVRSSHGDLYAAVRPSAGASFGPPSKLGRLLGIRQSLGVGIDAAGSATVAWLQEQSSRRPRSGFDYSQALLTVAASTPAGVFGPVQTLGRSLGNRVALAVQPDGRALLAADVPGAVRAYERLPGQSRFGHVRVRDGGAADDLAVALAPDGGAAIAFRNDERSVFAALRPPGGSFGRWLTVVPLERPRSGSSFSVSFSAAQAVDDTVGRGLRAALGAGGELVLSWVDAARGRLPATAYATRGTLSGGLRAPRRLGSPCRSASAAAPLALADGQLAVAWSDNALARTITESTIPLGGGRVHLARSRLVPGEARATPALAAPQLSANLVGPRALEPGDGLRVRVRCEAACDARVLARARSLPTSNPGFGGDGRASMWVAASTTLRAGGSAVLRLPRLAGFNPAGVRDRPRTPIEAIACSPAGPLAQRLELAPPAVADPPPLPRVIDLAAERRGGAIHISWRTAAPAARARFYVSTRPGYARVGRAVAGRGRSRFAVTLHPGRRRVRRVEVYLETPAVSFGPTVSVPVA